MWDPPYISGHSFVTGPDNVVRHLSDSHQASALYRSAQPGHLWLLALMVIHRSHGISLPCLHKGSRVST